MKNVILILGCVMLLFGMRSEAYAGLGDTDSDLVYTPVAPCRIIDTRATGAGGPIPGNGTRNFLVTGAEGFASQGGNPAGCGIPGEATAVMINFIAVGPPTGGHMRAWPYGESMPNASIINFVPGLNIANGLIQPICHPMSSCISDLSIYAASTVDVVADVTGYFRKPGPAYPRTTFKIVSLPAADSYTTLATLTFTPVATGTVYLRSRGYCNMFQYVSDDNDVWISAGTSTAEAFDDSVDSSDIHGWGVMSFPVTGSGLFQMMWTSERAFSVTKGVSTTVYLYARHYSGGTGTNCSGSFSIDQRF